MKIEIFKLKESNDDKFYVSLSQSDNDILELSELFLAGYTTEEILSVGKEDTELVSNPSASWKAAFLVWRNSVIKDEIENLELQKRSKFKKKMVELLAHKYQIDAETLFKILEELEEVEE
jgi:hypothetical protein